MPTSISGAVAGEGKEQCKHLALAFSIDYKISIGSHSLSRKFLLFSSSFYWNENRIVYERGFNLSANFNSNPEALLRKKPTHAISFSATPLTVEPISPAPSVSTTMARTLHDYSTPAVNTRNGNFELRTGLLTMVQANQFCGLPSEDANAHP